MTGQDKIIDWIKQYTVILRITDHTNGKTGRCVGIRITDGLVLTACHCLATMSDDIECYDMEGLLHENGQVLLYTNKNQLIIRSKNKARYIQKTDCPDMALLWFDDLKKIERVKIRKPKLLEKATIPVPLIRNGELIYPLISQGQIACYDPNEDRIYIDAFILPGTSGAPVINQRGQMIGLVTSLAYGNWALAYGSKTICQLLAV